MPCWSRPSASGRRVALDRKFKHNAAAVGNSLSLNTLTALGADQLPWDTDLCTHLPGEKCSGTKGCKVEWIYAEVYNRTFSARRSRLHEAAQKAADRYLRRVLKYEGQLPRLFGCVSGPQKRGVLHAHPITITASKIETTWARTYWRYVEKVCERESKMDQADVWAAIEREYVTGEITRGVYGFGFLKRGYLARSRQSVATYAARNAAGYAASNAHGANTWHHVSTRLTRETGVTMRALRSCNWLFVRRKMIAAGELEDEWVPSYWDAAWSENVLQVWALVTAAHAPPAE